MNTRSALTFLVIPLLVLCSCGQTLDQRALQAKPGTPLVSEVQTVSIPADHSRSTALVVVEPFTTPVGTNEAGRDLLIRINNERDNLTQKLTTALVRAGNIAVVDPRGLRERQDGTFTAMLRDREHGPYLVRAVITEFTEKATQQDSGRELSFGWVGVALGVAGLATGKPGLGWPGLGIALADPSFHGETMQRTGMVAFDIQIVDGRTLRVKDAFKATGSFMAASDKSGFGLFGYGQRREEFAQSVLGQAAQAAMNDAVTKIHRALVML